MTVSNRKVPIISVYDQLLGYKSIGIEQNEAVAIRDFSNYLIHVLESGDFRATDPSDLILYCLGTLDLDSGVIDVCEPTALIHGTSVITEWNIARCSHSDNKISKTDCTEEKKVGEEIDT